MKVLVLCYEYPPVGGGGGRVAAQVGAELARRGHEVKVQTAGMRHLPGRESINGVEIIRSQSFRKREDTCSVPEMALYLLTSFLPALHLARSWAPDVMHVHFAVPTGVLACAVSRITGVPYILTAHLGDVPGGVPEQTAHLFRLVDPVARVIWRSAARITAVSSFVAGLARKAYGADAAIIRNGVELHVRKNDPVANETPRLVFAGRLSVQKNPLLAIQSLALVKDIPWALDVIGEGPLGDAMRAEAARLGLSDRITFHGWLAAPEVSAIMARSDILLMTSLHEGLPMVGVEALQNGLAVIGSAIGGLQDIIDEGKNGFLCELNPEAFAARFRQVFSDRNLLTALRRSSREAAAKFDLAHSVSDYERILSEAARKTR